jgi:DNA polymerase sigma
MRYDIGDAPLEPPPVEPKKTLDPDEDDKLSGDMRELYDRLLPTEDSERRRRSFVQKLERILHNEWPGNEFKVHVFGSSGNMLCTSDSDGKLESLEEFGFIADSSKWIYAFKRP